MSPMMMQMVLIAGVVMLAAGAGLAQQKPAAGPSSQPAGGGPSAGAVTIRFWGHACFTLTADGKTALIDPYTPKIGYKAFEVQPDLVLISHEHFDHNDTSWLQGKPAVIHGLGGSGETESIDRRVGPFHVTVVPARHWSDPANQQRGNDAIFVIEVNGLRIVHVGDLGEALSEKQIQAIGVPDVLMVPVGGFYTINAEQAYEVAKGLKCRGYVIPMHYRTPDLEPSLRSVLAEPTGFIRKFGQNVARRDGNEITVDAGGLPKECTVVSMGYEPVKTTTTDKVAR